MHLDIIVEGIIREEDEDEKSQGPNFWFDFDGHRYPAWSSPRGRMHTAEYELSKFNRYAKIGDRADEIKSNLIKELKSRPNSINGRCAYACLLMMEHGIRTGNETSAEGYVSGLEDNKGELVKTYGVTTLLDDHVKIEGDVLSLHFLGKTQVEHKIRVLDDLMIKYGRYYQKHKNDRETWLGVEYDDLFKYIRNTVGDGFIPKDFRTFRGNVTAWDYIRKPVKKVRVETATEANDIIKKMVEACASVLGNTTGVSKSSYLDHRMIDWIKDTLMGL